MSLPGRKAPAGASGVRRWLVTVVVSVLALVLTLVVISLSQGSSLPRTSLHGYLPIGATDLGKRSSSEHADENRSGAAIGEELSQGERESLVEQNGQGGDVNSSQTSAASGKMDDNEPDPASSSDTTTIPDEDTSNESQKAEQGELLVRFPEISAQHIYQHEWDVIRHCTVVIY
jgi:hypothetical protein